ncbi:MAG: Rab family GTPase [Woeseiaceae bacterium]
MTQLTSKICIVGDFAVGKTSVAERFVNNQFSQKYLTTVGVKIDTKEIEHPTLGVNHKLIIWDVAGSDRFSHREFAYLRGASGYVYVADGTRPQTLGSVQQIRAQIIEQYGTAASIFLINKFDLVADWSIDDERLQELGAKDDTVFKTSAKTGDAVDKALTRLAEMIVADNIRGD